MGILLSHDWYYRAYADILFLSASYETGTNRLFEDRAEEFVIYDGILRSQLKKQGPDRVYGLKNTGNFDSLLSSSAPPELANEPGDTIGDIIKHTPFDYDTDPLLFPFLLLEAKSESSSNGFDDIQIQSAFPIRALLKLQEDLQASSSIPDPGMAPLVWFLACRGDAWKVYGCYAVPGEGDIPTKYVSWFGPVTQSKANLVKEMSILWSGSLMHKDQALQLVLIVDYIMDWARDIYRIEILTHLRSIVTGQLSDQMTYRDSDMFSTTGSIFNWIPPARSIMTEDRKSSRSVVTTDGLETSLSDYTTEQFSHQKMLNTAIPNTRLGSFRSAMISHFQFECLYITSDLIPSLFEMIGGIDRSKGRIESAARSFVNFVTQFDETLVMTWKNLELFELLWTGSSRSSLKGYKEEFFVTMEVSWFFNTSWDIKRKVSCLAISRTAFDALTKTANFRVKHRGVQNLKNTERICHEDKIRDLVRCLASGSPWQVLLAAISSTLLTLYPFPLRKRNDFTPPLETIGFGYIREARVDPFIQKILRRKMWAPTKRMTVSDSEMRAARHRGMTINDVLNHKRQRGERRPKHEDLSFKRISECQKQITIAEAHDSDHCARCLLSQEQNISSFGHGYLDHQNEPMMSSQQTIIVASLKANETRRMSGEPDTCVFGLNELSQLKNNASFAIMIEEMSRLRSFIFHTIQFDPGYSAATYDEVKYNLPLPYRLISRQERSRITDWVRELQDYSPDSTQKILDYSKDWDYNQRFLFLLSMGHSKEEAFLLLEHKLWPNHSRYCTMASVINDVNKRKVSQDQNSFLLRKKLKIAGDQLVSGFASCEAARDLLHQEYPYQSGLLESIAKRKPRQKD